MCRIPLVINKFDGDYEFLSNFYPSKVIYEGVEYPTVENAYQAAKTLDIDQRKVFEDISPGKAKRNGNKLVLRPDWEDVKILIMGELVEQKFTDEHLAEMLCSTLPYDLVEGNTWGDVFWGVYLGEGLNMLGHILMLVREEKGNISANKMFHNFGIQNELCLY